MTLRTSLPAFYEQLRSALEQQALTELLEQLPALEILGRCDCDEPGCATLYVKPSRALNVVEERIVGVRHGTSTPLDALEGLVVVDTDNFGRITTIEILGRADVANTLERLGVPRGGRRTSGCS